MRDILLLRFEAPLMAFGGVLVDSRGFTSDHPGRSLITGLLANALDWDHADHERLQSLQDRLRFASRCDRSGERIQDFHTVDLGQKFLLEGWTTRGAVERRGGGPAKEGTHIRERHYFADRIQTVALTLDGVGDSLLDDVHLALHQPARPLFIGRKTCLPSRPILFGRVQAETVIAALQCAPRHRNGNHQALSAWWPHDESGPTPNRVEPVNDERNWLSQSHTGRRLIRAGLIDPPAAEAAHV